MSKKLKRAEQVAKRGQQRPLGFLMGWLSQHALHETAHSHKFEMFELSREDRTAGREELREIDGSQALFEQERPKLTADEDSEPEAFA